MKVYDKEVFVRELNEWKKTGIASITEEEAEVLNSSSKTVRYVPNREEAEKAKQTKKDAKALRKAEEAAKAEAEAEADRKAEEAAKAKQAGQANKTVTK